MMQAVGSDDDSGYTNVHSNQSWDGERERNSETDSDGDTTSSGLLYGMSSEVAASGALLPLEVGEVPSAMQRGAEMPWGRAGVVRPAVPPSQPDKAESRVPTLAPAPSVLPNRTVVKAEERAGADGVDAVCYVCTRSCEGTQRRLGVFWKKFGYEGTFCRVSRRL